MGRLLAAVVVPLLLIAAAMIGSITAMVRWIAPGSAAFLVLTLALAVVYHTGGGWLGMTLARGRAAALGWLALLATLLMLSSVARTWTTVPPWYSLAMLAIAPAGIYAGMRLRRS